MLDRFRIDPRHYQIAVLTGLIAYGATVLHLEVRPLHVATSVSVALVCQWLASRVCGIPFDPRSPLISALSLSLLLRSDFALVYAAGAAIAILSKFLIRWNGKHIFNPTNGALVALMLLTDSAWVSPGQWGSHALAALALAGAGSLVVYRSARSDVTYAFLIAYCGVVFGRALWLGDPLTIPWHQLQSGSLLIFAFYMISDPKTTPNSRAGRVLFALLVAALAGYLKFQMYQPAAIIWSLVCCAPLVPLIDRLMPGRLYQWRPQQVEPPRAPTTVFAVSAMRSFPSVTPTPFNLSRRHSMKRTLVAFLLAATTGLASISTSEAFCGFYVARADTQLFNKASQVVLVRDGDRTVLTMANDFKGELDEFAMVIPVPTLITREQIHVADMSLIDHLDAYTAPRLVEYFDPDPCARREMAKAFRSMAEASDADMLKVAGEARPGRLGVTIEASYTVGEYDILILSAKQSDGLITWLKQNDYRIPDGAESVVSSYLRSGMKFFVAKVNLEQQSKLGFSELRPLQVAYESNRFMLPIRLGMVNANGKQELFVYALTRTGRIETTNYRTVRLPTGTEIPPFVKDEFSNFYRDMFAQQVERENEKAVFLEYAWDMAWCDPCAANPLSRDQLQELGVFWLDEASGRKGPAQNVFVSRLHVRYDKENFPEDLFFQETGDRTNFQGRYVLRHPFKGPNRCSAYSAYRSRVSERQEREAQALANLTGWDIATIRDRIGLPESSADSGSEDPWWKRIWKR